MGVDTDGNIRDHKIHRRLVGSGLSSRAHEIFSRAHLERWPSGVAPKRAYGDVSLVIRH